MPREIIVARSAGQCFGVKRAFNIAMEAAEGEESVAMLGDIVHNEHVVRRIDEAGVKVVPEVERVDEGGTLLVRAHGAAPEVYEKAHEQGLKLLDAMAMELPIVSHPMAAEGLGVRAGEQLLEASDAAGLAAAVERLLCDAELRRTLARAGRRHVVERFAADAVQARLLDAYERAIALRRARGER